MSEKKDWSIYSRHGVPVKDFFMLAVAIRVYSANNGSDAATRPNFVPSLTEELCEEWLAHNPSPEIKEALTGKKIDLIPKAKRANPEPLGAMAPPLQQAPALCGHQSDPDPHGTRHTCVIAMGHIGQHQDQEWSWFPTDWKPTRKTL